MKVTTRVALLVLTLAAIGSTLTVFACANAQATYDLSSVEAWRQEREQELRAPDGWLSVAGLFFLKPGVNTIGSAPDSHIMLPADVAPARAGTVTFDGHRAVLAMRIGVEARVNGKLLQGPAELTPPEEGRPAGRVVLGRLTLHLHRSGERLAMRLRDPDHQLRRDFAGLEWFDIDPQWVISGRFHAFPEPKPVEIANVLGDVQKAVSPGEVTASIDGQDVRLLALSEKDGQLWFVFSDALAGTRTYRTRYLYAPAPRDGTVTLDFNRAYNPPCAYNPHTTCPLPPPQNRLKVAIAAGEKAYSGQPPTS